MKFSNTHEWLTYLNNEHPGCRLEGYECNPDNFKVLQKNNNLPNLKVFEKAIGWETGKIKLFEYEYPAWHSIYPKHKFDKRKLVSEIQVDAITIDNLITEKVDLLLLNCEGCEIAVMDSIVKNETLRNNIVQLSTSFHDGKCYDNVTKQKILLLMEQYYNVHVNNSNEVTYYLFIKK